MEADASELECRVCRMGPESDRPLYTPCLCSGSIGLVHQDCLEAWLDHSKKDTCELCFSKYEFTAQYAEGAPTTLPLWVMLKSIFSIMFVGVIPYVLRVLTAVVIWLVFVPVATTTVYCVFIGRQYSSTGGQSNLIVSIVTGIVLDAVVALSMLVLMSFTDFLRFHWMPQEEQNRVALAGNNAAPNNADPANGGGRAGMRRRNAARRRQPGEGPGGAAGNNRNNVNVWPLPPVQQAVDANDPQPAAGNEEGGAQGEPNEWEEQMLQALERRQQMRQQQQLQQEVLRQQQQELLRQQQFFGDVPADEANDNPQEPVGGAGLAPPLVNQPPLPVGGGAFDEDHLALGAEDVQEVGMEIRVALFDMLGIEGAFYIMFRNALLLLAFTSLYIAIMAALPYLLGRMALTLLARRLPAAVTTSTPLLSSVLETLSVIVERSESSGNPLQVVDFAFAATGYSTVVTAVLLLYCLSLLVSVLPANKLVTPFVTLVGRLAVIVKVGILLIMRIFLLPVFLGSLLLCLATHSVLHYSFDAWVGFMVLNPVGAYAFAWVCGITFMLTMTISVLQLREVLHPAFFAKLIRPQEAHNDLINSLVQEGGLTHARRVAVSLAVYILLMLLFLYTPLTLYQSLLNAAYPEARNQPLAVHLWYVVPQIQIPLELLICHITFLSILDRKKDVIGHAQHHFLVFMSDKLGLTRFIIPCPLVAKDSAASLKNGADSALTVIHAHDDLPSSSSLVVSTASTPAAHGAPAKALVEEPPLPEVGPPLLRPPVGWDLRTPNNSTRWAWGTETPSEVEKTVAPRVAPSFWLLRCIVLLLVSWALVSAVTLTVVLVPLNIGRLMFKVAQVEWLTHDPFCFLIGCLVCLSLHHHWPDLKSFVPTRLPSLPLAVLAKVVKLSVMWVVMEFSVGLIATFLRNPMVQSEADLALVQEVSLVSVLSTWLKGCIIVEVSLAILFSNTLGPALMRACGLEDVLVPWVTRVRQVVAEIRQSLSHPDWTLQSLPLDDIEQLMVAPLFNHFVALGSVPILATSFAFSANIDTLSLAAPLLCRNLKVASLGLFSYWLVLFIIMPTRKWLSALHKKIRDDNYLVGRTLNNAAGSKPKDE